MMELVSTVTLGSNAASIEFTNIPQTGKDLVILHSCRSTRSAEWNYVLATFNNSASSYNDKVLYGSGASASSFGTQSGFARFFAGQMSGNTATSNTFGNNAIYISNYASSANKSVSTDGVSENNGTQGSLSISASIWSNSNAITSVKLLDYDGANFMQHSTASLYIVS